MKRKTTIFVLAAIAVALLAKFATSAPQPTGNVDAKVLEALLHQLETFSAQNGATTKELLKALTRLNIKDPSMAKGGVGIVRSNIYVSTFTHTNAILIGEEWFETPTNGKVTTVLVVSKGKVVGNAQLKEGGADDLLFVVYKPNAIEFFDWNTGNGGTYQRRKD